MSKPQMDALDRQNAEFDALAVLCSQYKNLCSVAVVDDNYPEARLYYERALRIFLEKVAINRKLKVEPLP